MTETKFTHGPYHVEDDQVLGGELGLEVVCAPLGSTPEQALANAHLFASAPEMYEALQHLLDCVYGGGLEAIDEAEAALAKARGEQ